MSHTSGNILLHLIFSAQGRRPLIKPDFRGDLFAYLGGIIREMHGTALNTGDRLSTPLFELARFARGTAESAVKY
jgi:hypothetical protein